MITLISNVLLVYATTVQSVIVATSSDHNGVAVPMLDFRPKMLNHIQKKYKFTAKHWNGSGGGGNAAAL